MSSSIQVFPICHFQFCRLDNFLSLKANLFLKIEGFNPAGSIKIKPAIRMLEALEEKGLISPDYSHIIESSSGNLGVAVSIACSVKGYSFTCISDPNISSKNAQYIKMFGAELIIVKNKDETGTVLAGINAYAHKLDTATNIVAISPDMGDRYLDTVYNDEWVLERFPSCLRSTTN